MKLFVVASLLLLYASQLSSKEIHLRFSGEKVCDLLLQHLITTYENPNILTDSLKPPKEDTTIIQRQPTVRILQSKTELINTFITDSTKSSPTTIDNQKKKFNSLVIRNNFTKNLLKYLISSQNSNQPKSGEQSISYFNQFRGKRIASIRLVRLHPFGTSLRDTSLIATRWIDKTGNKLHMNTAKTKLTSHLLFKIGDIVNPLLMAENEKIMRDLEYLEDVFFRLDPVENSLEDVNVIILTKDKFEYAFNMSIDAQSSDVSVLNENMFGLGHRLNIGIAQKNNSLPEMGLYFSYDVNNILGKFINSTIGYSDTYLKKGWNISLEKKFLTSNEENAGGFSLEKIAKYNHITENHPIELDTSISYNVKDLWFMHAFSGTTDKWRKTILSFRYYHQKFEKQDFDSFGESQFIRNHDFFITSLSFSKRNLYKNSLIYGYGVTEDIPYGHFYEISSGLDKSQFGTWPYLGLSLTNAYIDKEGRYFSGRLSLDGFLDDGSIKQGTFLVSSNFFSKKFIAFGDPFRGFIKIELMTGINRFKEEYLTIDGRFGIRDFYTKDLRGYSRLKVNFEAVRYLKWNFYNFKFTNYIFTDFAFLSNQLKMVFSQNFYAGIGTGLRIYNESLVFKIIDVRLTWFPFTPPEGLTPFRVNLQGLTKSRFEDFMGRKPEVIRYQ